MLAAVHHPNLPMGFTVVFPMEKGSALAGVLTCCVRIYYFYFHKSLLFWIHFLTRFWLADFSHRQQLDYNTISLLFFSLSISCACWSAPLFRFFLLLFSLGDLSSRMCICSVWLVFYLLFFVSWSRLDTVLHFCTDRFMPGSMGMANCCVQWMAFVVWRPIYSLAFLTSQAWSWFFLILVLEVHVFIWFLERFFTASFSIPKRQRILGAYCMRPIYHLCELVEKLGWNLWAWIAAKQTSWDMQCPCDMQCYQQYWHACPHTTQLPATLQQECMGGRGSQEMEIWILYMYMWFILAWSSQSCEI